MIINFILKSILEVCNTIDLSITFRLAGGHGSAKAAGSTPQLKIRESWKLNLFTFQPISANVLATGILLADTCCIVYVNVWVIAIHPVQPSALTVWLQHLRAWRGRWWSFRNVPKRCDAMRCCHIDSLVPRLTVWWQKVCGHSHFSCELKAVTAACKAAITYKQRWVKNLATFVLSKSSRQSRRQTSVQTRKGSAADRAIPAMSVRSWSSAGQLDNQAFQLVKSEG